MVDGRFSLGQGTPGHYTCPAGKKKMMVSQKHPICGVGVYAYLRCILYSHPETELNPVPD